MYDKLGNEGILGVSAVTNTNIDVDELGDMPTTCTSPFQITVADVDLTDTHLGGFGAINVDIAAPGHGSISTGKPSTYKVFDGTSASAPHLSGTIALMYSTPCTFFLDGIDSDPKSIAEKVRDIIFATGDNNTNLEDITVTGKRLQTAAAMQETVDGACDTTSVQDVHIISLSPNPPSENEVYAFFEVRGDTSTAYFELYTSTGALIHHYPVTQTEWTQGYLRVNTQPLPPGIYFLTLHNKKDRDTAKIFVY
ncbi:MAG: S8 family peptidase, partial [Saprospiraceae bacterium]